MKEYSDHEIIECLRKRQSYVVRYLSERYMPMIRLMIYRMGGSSDDAKDIFQEGLIIILEKIYNKNFILTCKFKTFFYCICENLWKSVLEKKRAAANYVMSRIDSNYENDFTEVLDTKLYETIFKDVFDSLDEISKKILTLYWQEISPQDIAGILGYTYGYVRKKKCEAQAEFIKRLKNHHDFKFIKSEKMMRDKV